MLMVVAVIGLAIFLFVSEWVRVDVVGIMMMVILPIMGLISGKEAFVGLSSNAVVSIIAVIIIGAGLDKTGIINRLVRPIVRLAGRSESRIIILISVTVATISAFMQNIGAAALFLPAIQRISKRLSIPVSNLLMPIGFSAILGGTQTLIGCSPLILLNDLLIPFKLKPFNLFDVTPIGFALVCGGILYFVTFGRFLLPGRKDLGDQMETASTFPDAYRHLGEMFELKSSGDGADSLAPRTIRDHYLVHVIAFVQNPGGVKVFSLDPTQSLPSNSDIVVLGRRENVQRLASDYRMSVKDGLQVFAEDMSPTVSGMVEAVVSPRSEIVDKTMGEVYFRQQFQVNPLALYRRDKIYYAGLSNIVLQPGDTILLQGSWERFKILQDKHSFLFSTPFDAEILRPEKTLMAGICFVVAIGLVIFSNLRLSVCLMAGALGMILTRVISIDEAYRSVDWRTIFLLGGLIPLGIATEKTGTAAFIAHKTLAMLGDVSPIVLLTAIGVLSTLFTLVISNVGATVLLVPLVVNMAILASADPRMAALVVGLATSNSFMLPTHQVNALYMGPGGYRSVDFMRAGSIMSIIFIVIMISMIYLIYGV
jgi:di/tricarboxylate transporter